MSVVSRADAKDIRDDEVDGGGLPEVPSNSGIFITSQCGVRQAGSLLI